MQNTIDTFIPVNQPEYSKHFWNYAIGRDEHEKFLEAGMYAEAYRLPTNSETKYNKALVRESLFRRIGTYVYTRGESSMSRTKDSHDVAAWTDINHAIPVYDAINDFKDIELDDKKLAMIVKLDSSFLHDNEYQFESHLINRLARSFGQAENDGFLNGNGVEQPEGLLHSAEMGVSVAGLSYDAVVRLFFSLDKDYRSRAAWIMNDETAMALRLLKDANGNPLWNHSNDTIFGKEVFICNEMPSATVGNAPICFGDYSYFWVVERSPMYVRILRERFFDTDQIGYLAQERLDSKLIRPDAVKVMKINN